MALTPRNFTEVIPTKPLPEIVTAVPLRPLVGVKLLMLAAMPKIPVLWAVPSGVVTLMRPVVAAAGTKARITLSEETRKSAITLLNFTAVAPEKLAPKMVTSASGRPDAGVKDVIKGAPRAATTKLLELVAVPPAVTTRIGPVDAPGGTRAITELSESTA